MQISSHNTLPVITGFRPEAPQRQPTPPQRPTVEAQTYLPAIDNAVNSDNGNRRPPVFVQASFDQNMTHKGEQAVRAYRDVALSGDDAELVNRLNVSV